MAIYDNEFATKENTIWTKDKIEPQQVFFVSFVLHHLVIAPFHNTNSRGQKCWDLSSNISKTSNPSLSHPKQSWILSTMGGNESFSGHNIAGGEWGDDGMNPKPIKKMLLGAECYVRVFAHSPKIFWPPLSEIDLEC